MTAIRWILIAPMVVLLGCSSSPSPRLVQLFGDQSNFDTVKNASTVKAYRLQPVKPKTPDGIKYPLPLEVIAGPIVQNDAQRKRLITLLTTESTYGWNMAKGCIPTYGVRFEFEQNEQVITADICFNCSMLEFRRNDLQLGVEDFDVIAKELRELAQTLFPDDQVLRDFGDYRP